MRKNSTRSFSPRKSHSNLKTARGENSQYSAEVVLSDPKSTWEDKEARSVSYFCRKRSVRVDARVVAGLKVIAARLGGEDARLCLHGSPGAAFHEMLVLVHKGKYYRPHKHVMKDESCYIIEGSVGMFVCEEDGSVADACLLEKKGDFLYRVGANMYHTILPLTDLVIFLESKIGPYKGKGDSIYASWSPDGSNAGKIVSYSAELRQILRHTVAARATD